MNKVIWYEGMHLLPHHFQQQDRYLENLIRSQFKITDIIEPGLIDLVLDLHFLERDEIHLKKCILLLPDNTLVDIPKNDEAPTPINVSDIKSTEKIYLGIPYFDESSIECSHQDKPNFRYQTQEKVVLDNHQYSNIEARNERLLLVKLNLKLLRENEKEGHLCLALFQLKRNENGNLSLSQEGYIPPCVNIYATEFLRNFLIEFEDLILQKIKETTEKITRHKLTPLDENFEIYFLSLLNRAKGFLIFNNFKRFLKPFELYYFLFSFLQELSTFKNKERTSQTKITYSHNELYQSLLPLILEIKSYLNTASEENITTLNPTIISKNFWKIEISDKSLLERGNFILGIYLNLDAESKTDLYRRIRLSPLEVINDLIYRSLPGIDIIPIPTLPREIPHKIGFSYFYLNQNHELWQQLKKSTAIAVYLSVDYENVKISAWMHHVRT